MTAWQDALFTPRRVAVVGASATRGKAGYLFSEQSAQGRGRLSRRSRRDPSFRDRSSGRARPIRVSSWRPDRSISRSS